MSTAIEKRASFIIQKKVKASVEHYNAASLHRRQTASWRPFLPGPNASLDNWTRLEIIARCRDAVRNQPLAKAAVDRNTINVIGTGLKPNSTIDFEALGITATQAAEKESEFERAFAIWANNPRECDSKSKRSFYGLQKQIYKSRYIAGDAFALTPFLERKNSIFGTKIQIIESERVCNKNQEPNTPNLIDGVQIDSFGSPVFYHVTRAHPNEIDQNLNNFLWDKVPVWSKSGFRRSFHVGNSDDRPDAQRHEPPLAAVLEELKNLDDYAKSEIFAAVLASDPAVAVTSESAMGFEDLAPPMPGLNGPLEFGADEEDEIRFGPGVVVDLAPGEKIQSLSPGRPNHNYEPFVLAKYKEFGAGICIPIEILILHFGQSFSAAKAAFNEYWKYVLSERSDMGTSFCIPSWRLWFSESIARGIITAPGFGNPLKREAWLKHEWIGPSRGTIQELQAANAAEKRIEIGVSSIEKEAAAIGHDRRTIHKQRKIEQKERKEDGLLEEKNKNSQERKSAQEEPVTNPDN